MVLIFGNIVMRIFFESMEKKIFLKYEEYNGNEDTRRLYTKACRQDTLFIDNVKNRMEGYYNAHLDNCCECHECKYCKCQYRANCKLLDKLINLYFSLTQ